MTNSKAVRRITAGGPGVDLLSPMMVEIVRRNVKGLRIECKNGSCSKSKALPGIDRHGRFGRGRLGRAGRPPVKGAKELNCLRSMQKILTYTAMVAMSLLAWSAGGATPAVKKAPPKKGGTRRAAATRPPGATKKQAPSAANKPATGSTTASAVRRGGKKTPARRATTWRNRQIAPTPERYREIQAALVAKGYLKSEDAGGPWNQTSVDALKNFQTEQNLESTGKINSLSLIALGLGPRHEATPAAAKPPVEKPPVEKPPVEKPPGGEQGPGQHW
jgi:hypothetical protein